MQRHGDGIFDVKKIALLFTVAKIGAVTLEQPDDAIGLHLRRGFVDERPHVAFVVFVRAEDVEVFQAGDLV